MVLDPDMLLQLTKKTAESMKTSSGHTGNKNSRRGKRAPAAGARGSSFTPPHSHVDAWKSINGRPFSPWIDPLVDVWDGNFGVDGPSPREWLKAPPSEAELDRAEGTMEVCTSNGYLHVFVCVCFC